MKKETKKKNGFVDALAMEMHYALLTKDGRIQILIKPTAKELRRRGQRGWHLHSTVDSHVNPRQELYDALQAVLSEMESATETAPNKEKKPKKGTAKNI